MASGVLLRRIGQQSLRYISKSYVGVQLNRNCARKLHLSASVLQKYFTEKHEWVNIPDGSQEGTVGITEYAQDALGDVVYVQLPEKGDELELDDEAGVLESVKAASDIYCPVSGEITDTNDDVVDKPGLINTNPYDKGWLFKIALSEPSELDDLMTEDAYKTFLTTL